MAAFSAGTYTVAYSGSSASATFSTAATFVPVLMIAPMVAASPVTRPAATLRTTVSPLAVRTLRTGAFVGDPLALLGEDGGDLAGDGALQEVAALPVREDGGRAHRGRHRARHGPHRRGRHDDHRHGQHEPALGAGEAHREVELLRRLQLGEGLLAELHGFFPHLRENEIRMTTSVSPGTGKRFRDLRHVMRSRK